MAKREKASSVNTGDGGVAVASTDEKKARKPAPRARKTSDDKAGQPATDAARETAPQTNAQATGDVTGGANGTAPPAPQQQRTDLDIEKFRALLFQERSRLESERDVVRQQGQDMEGVLPEEGEGADEDTADMASAMMDKEYNLSVEDEIEELMAAVDRALQKIDDGTYGVCDMSGEAIPESRLELLPYASLTVECQALSEG